MNYDKWLMSDNDCDRFWGNDDRDEPDKIPGLYIGEWEDEDDDE